MWVVGEEEIVVVIVEWEDGIMVVEGRFEIDVEVVEGGV